jgi:hypothetical protein
MAEIDMPAQLISVKVVDWDTVELALIDPILHDPKVPIRTVPEVPISQVSF